MVRILGIDLAWGYRNPDGVCSIEIKNGNAYVNEIGLVRGSAALKNWVQNYTKNSSVMAMVDAPIICPNPSGSRPVDRLSHVKFGRFKAGCYPANQKLCPRPVEVGNMLRQLGFEISWEIATAKKKRLIASEVYPHIAIIRFFGLKERLRYKKGPVGQRRKVFSHLQKLVCSCLRSDVLDIKLTQKHQFIFEKSWTKDIEDQMDALICGLVGYWHWIHNGQKTEILGDKKNGFIVVPSDSSGLPDYSR
jgi:predicted RNase H-like nuclease